MQGDDSEVLLRMAFRRVPMPQWKDLIQQISYGSGFAGDVSEVTASSPEKTDEPFHFSYSYKRKDYPNWSGRQISSPLPPMLAAAPDSKPDHPAFSCRSGRDPIRIASRTCPRVIRPNFPARSISNRTSPTTTYPTAFKNDVLITERHFVVKLRDVPLTEYDAYKKFAKAVCDDHERYIALSSGEPSGNSLQNAISNLPNSDDPKVARAYDDAVAAAQSNNVPGAIDLPHAGAGSGSTLHSWPHVVGTALRLYGTARYGSGTVSRGIRCRSASTHNLQGAGHRPLGNPRSTTKRFRSCERS